MSLLAYLFPGQGAQYVGMGREIVDITPAKEVFEEANDILGMNLLRTLLEGPEDTLKRTDISQPAIFVTSIAFLRLVEKEFPHLSPAVVAGLSLGEYTALVAAKKSSFQDTLRVVQKRGRFMSEACDKEEGAMVVVVGLESALVEKMVADLSLPADLWAANFNCPGQVVLSGTKRGIAAGTEAAKALGAKRVLPLEVHGAFHSGLMRSARERLKPFIEELAFTTSSTHLVMNVTGEVVEGIDQMRENLEKQVTESVRFEKSLRTMEAMGVTRYLEIGPGTTLAGMVKRTVLGSIHSIGKREDFACLCS